MITNKTIKEICSQVEEILFIEPNLILKKCRYREVVYARWMIQAYLREEKELTLYAIGRLWNTHHTNVIYAMEQHKLMRQQDNSFVKNDDKIRKYLIEKFI